MLQHFLNNTSQTDKNNVDVVIKDIDLFYALLQQYDEAFEEWYFKKMFNTPYWHCLKHYSWLSTKEQNYLHQGVLTFILFMSYQYLNGKTNIVESRLKEIAGVLKQFNGNNSKTNKLKDMTQSAVEMAQQKKSENFSNNSKIVKSIKWVLTNIIIENETKINQR